MSKKIYINQSALCPTMSFVRKIGIHNQTSVVKLVNKLQKYPKTFVVVFFVSLQNVRNVVELTHFFARCCHTLKRRHNTSIPMHMSSFGLNKRQVSLASRENWLSLKRNETKVH